MKTSKTFKLSKRAKIDDRMENINPKLFEKVAARPINEIDLDDSMKDPIDSREIFDLIRNLNDPEHPLTLEELHVVEEDNIEVSDDKGIVQVMFTPTIPHCSMATLIGLCVRVKLLRSLPPRFKISVKISPGTHVSERAINKQLADKERIAAALENTFLLEAVNQCLTK